MRRQSAFVSLTPAVSRCPLGSAYYNKPSQEGMYRHFAYLAEASPLPLVLYNVPGRVGVNMAPDTAVRLARDFDNIIGIKEASGYPQQAAQITACELPEDFASSRAMMHSPCPSSRMVLWA